MLYSIVKVKNILLAVEKHRKQELSIREVILISWFAKPIKNNHHRQA